MNMIRRSLSTAPKSHGAAAPLLEGKKVVELASVLAGPSVGQFLAELGATVIKVENMTTGGDVTRTWRLPSERKAAANACLRTGVSSDKSSAGWNDVTSQRDAQTKGNNNLSRASVDGKSLDLDDSVTAYFSACNMGKQSIALDIRNARGLDAVHRLVRDADVVLASYKPGDAEKLGVDYETVSLINPKVVYAQITGYGMEDQRSGYDAVIQAESGFQYMNGYDSPTKMPVAMMDLLASHQLKEGVLAGLLRRELHGGNGSFVTVSLLGAGVASLANQGTGYLLEGVVPQRLGNDHPTICPYGTIFTCKDGGLVTLAIGNDKQFVGLCEALGAPELAIDERFKTNPARVEHREACKSAIKKRISAISKSELLSRLRHMAIPAGGVNSLDAVFNQPQAQELVFRDTDSGDPVGLRQIAFKEYYSLSSSGKLEQTTSVELANPPIYGEHTTDVLMEHGGFSSEEVDDLVQSGVAEAR